MSHQTPVKRVFFHVLRGNEYAFADERTRRYLLNIMEEIQRQADWQVYAFCMTNRDAYFVIEAKSLASLSRDLADIAEQFRARCRALLPNWWSESIQICPGNGKRLRTEREIKEYCCQIHRLPLEYGYVKRLVDYWWSSYITYTGIYDWRIVDCEWLLGQFAKQPSRARQRLKDYHQMVSPAFDIDNGEVGEM